MNITLMAHDKKKELMVQFCTAYKSILCQAFHLPPTATTGRLVAEATGLPVTSLPLAQPGRPSAGRRAHRL